LVVNRRFLVAASYNCQLHPPVAKSEWLIIKDTFLLLLHAQILSTILKVTITILLGGWGGQGEEEGSRIWSFMNSKNLHNEHDIHTSFETYKESDYTRFWFSHSLRVSNPTRSGCKEKINVHLKAMYLDTLSLTSSSHCCCWFVPII